MVSNGYPTVVLVWQAHEAPVIHHRCPKNTLGDRELPKKKPKKKKGKETEASAAQEAWSDEEEEVEDDLSLAEAIR